jgi:hypothetical protein
LPLDPPPFGAATAHHQDRIPHEGTRALGWDPRSRAGSASAATAGAGSPPFRSPKDSMNAQYTPRESRNSPRPTRSVW